MDRATKRILKISAGMILMLALIFFAASQTKRSVDTDGAPGLDSPVQAPEPNPEVMLIRGVVQDNLPSTLLDPEDNFGKGRIGAFTFNAPREGNFRIEEMKFAIEGSRDGDIAHMWLRLNGNGIFTEAEFLEDNRSATFRQFPPITKPNTQTPQSVPNVEGEVFFDEMVTQLLLHPDADMPQVMPAGTNVRVTLYALWGESVAPRAINDGLHLCLLSLKGSVITIVGEDSYEEAAAETKFAAPLCWKNFGIEE